MAKQKFIDWNPQATALERIDQCNEIIEEYQDQGLRMTLRQLYYQLVSRDLIENKNTAYRQLGTVLSQARLAGLVDWAAIEDRGRRPDTPSEWNSIQGLVESALRAYRLPRLKKQRIYPELWVEKQALAGVLAPLASEYHATLMVNKGYSSQSAMFESAERIMRNVRDNDSRAAFVFYLGDHDPSGEDMVRDIRDRLTLFLGGMAKSMRLRPTKLEVIKIALTWEQIEQYDPPPNPTKLTDSRAPAYVEKYGYESWEVDALPPTVLQEVIRASFDDVMKTDLVNSIIAIEEADKDALREAVRDL